MKFKYTIFDDTPIIGIDLGTTYSCVSVFRNGEVEIIPNSEGDRTTPSVVSWDKKGKMLVGNAAKNNAVFNPNNTYYDVKRLIGRRFSEILNKDAKLLSYELVKKKGKVFVQRTKGDGNRILYQPEQISSFVLGHLKKQAEKYLGEEVKYAVITVPAYFNDMQRQATKDAGAIAGLKVIRIINEPTAASMTYGLDKTSEHNILVFDLGGGTFDVSLLTLDDGVFEVVATSGDMHLGGEDFDLRVVDYLAKVWEKKTGLDFRRSKKSFQMVKQQAEIAKIILSAKLETNIVIQGLMNGKNMNERLTRAKFEALNMDLFKNSLKPVAKVLKDSSMRKNDIQEVVLVGGSTRIPKIQDLLSNFFGGKRLHKEVNPDEAVAHGAALQAAIINGDLSGNVLVDVNALSLGVEMAGGVMSVIIPHNTQIPCKKAEQYTTTHDNQEVIKIPIYEGERRKAKDNRLLGEFELTGIPRAPRGVPKIVITFDLDENGILTCTAEEKETGKKKELKIIKDNLGQDEIEKLRKEADFHKNEDKQYLKKVKLKQKFFELHERAKIEMDKKEVYSRFERKEGKKIKHNIHKVSRWLSKYQDEATYDQMKKQYSNFLNYIDTQLSIDDGSFNVDEIEREFEDIEDDIEDDIEMDMEFGDDDDNEIREEVRNDVHIEDEDIEEVLDDIENDDAPFEQIEDINIEDDEL